MSLSVKPIGLMLALLFAALWSGSSSAQISRQEGGSSGAQEATVTYAGVQLKLVRLVKEADEGKMRLITQITDSESPGRPMALVRPQPYLLDEFGNRYDFTSMTGLIPCTWNRNWSDASSCFGNRNDLVVLRSAVQTPTVISFAPASEGFARDLAAMSETVTLFLRFAVYSTDVKKADVEDIVIPGIVLPR